MHESAGSAEIWRPLAAAMTSRTRVIAPDRRGWGGSEAPQPYLRTTIEEHSEDAAALLVELDAAPAILCGAGLGAVVALDLMLRRADLVEGAVLIEPPLLAYVPEATDGLSADRAEIERAVREAGPAGAVDLYLEGGLPYLGPGAGRLPREIGDLARKRPLSLFAELGAVPAWPLRSGALAEVERPSRVVVSASSPPHLRRAAEELASRLGATEVVRFEGEGLPHVDAVSELAGVIAALAET